MNALICDKIKEKGKKGSKKAFYEVLKLICGVDDVFYGICVENVPWKSFEIIMTNLGRSMRFGGRLLRFHTGMCREQENRQRREQRERTSPEKNGDCRGSHKINLILTTSN